MSDYNQLEAKPTTQLIFDQLWLVWLAIFYLSLLIGMLLTLPKMLGAPWQIAALGLLSALSLVLFHRYFLPVFRTSGWPLPSRRASLYFGAQALILVGMGALNGEYIGLGFALMGQVLGSMPPRRWPLPVLIFLLLIGWMSGLLSSLAAGNWGSLFSFSFTTSIFIILALLIYQLFEQRHQLLQLISELREAKAALEAGAAQQEELATLRERTRLAREMHDTLGHALVVVNVKLEAAQRLYRQAPSRGDAELEATRALVRETMSELRRSIADLRAPLPNQRDLPAALRRLADETGSQSGLTIKLALPDQIDLDPQQASAFLQIAREAFRNIQRHATAASVGLSLEATARGWCLRIIDDGSGISPADLRKPGHFGLIGMRERAEALGGSLHIGRAPHTGGTVVEALLPR